MRAPLPLDWQLSEGVGAAACAGVAGVAPQQAEHPEGDDRSLRDKEELRKLID